VIDQAVIPAYVVMVALSVSALLVLIATTVGPAIRSFKLYRWLRKYNHNDAWERSGMSELGDTLVGIAVIGMVVVYLVCVDCGVTP